MISIKTETARVLLRDYRIEPDTTYELFRIGALSEQGCRDMLIKEEYKRKVQPKQKRIIKHKLADQFCISIDLVEKITCKKSINII